MERKFADHLEALRAASSLDVDWEYEPMVSLAGLTYKPDFVELWRQTIKCYHEIKIFRRHVSKATGKVSYRAIDSRWPTIKKLWRLHGPKELKVWMWEKKAFKLIDAIEPIEGKKK